MLSAGVVVALLLTVAGCDRGEPPPGRSPNLSNFDERVSRANRLPDEFPRDFPLPGKRDVLYSAVSRLGVVVYFDAPDSSERISDFLLDRLPKEGWTLRTCQLLRASPDPVRNIVAAKGRTVATTTVGHHPDFAARLDGKRFAFLVSVAFSAEPPTSTAAPC